MVTDKELIKGLVVRGVSINEICKLLKMNAREVDELIKQR